MSKYVLKNNPNEEVNLGDEITISARVPNGTLTIVRTIDKEYLEELIKDGIVVATETKRPSISIDSLVVHLASRIQWKPENVDKYLQNLYSISPISVFQILLKECAIVLDDRYEGHITDQDTLWVISSTTGEAVEVPVDPKAKMTNVALFRTREDAEFARNVFKRAIKELF